MSVADLLARCAAVNTELRLVAGQLRVFGHRPPADLRDELRRRKPDLAAEIHRRQAKSARWCAEAADQAGYPKIADARAALGRLPGVDLDHLDLVLSRRDPLAGRAWLAGVVRLARFHAAAARRCILEAAAAARGKSAVDAVMFETGVRARQMALDRRREAGVTPGLAGDIGPELAATFRDVLRKLPRMQRERARNIVEDGLRRGVLGCVAAFVRHVANAPARRAQSLLDAGLADYQDSRSPR